MPFKRQKSNVSPHYHDTRTLLRKYRDVMWNLEVSDLDLQEEFKAEYVLVCMRKILREMQNRESSFQILCQAYMDIIVVQLMRNASVSAVPIHSRLPANRQCATVKRYIDHHYKENITLDQLAEKVSITKYYMVHAFKREYGVSPINYIINCRIKEGKRLLAETDLSLSQIAAILGFSSSSYFSQTFRNAEGTSPTEYRKANQVKF